MKKTHSIFGPLKADSPLLKIVCPGCDLIFVEGERVTLVPIGPGDDTDEQEKAFKGRPYNAVAIPLHLPCAGIDPSRISQEADNAEN